MRSLIAPSCSLHSKGLSHAPSAISMAYPRCLLYTTLPLSAATQLGTTAIRSTGVSGSVTGMTFTRFLILSVNDIDINFCIEAFLLPLHLHHTERSNVPCLQLQRALPIVLLQSRPGSKPDLDRCFRQAHSSSAYW